MGTVRIIRGEHADLGQILAALERIERKIDALASRGKKKRQD